VRVELGLALKEFGTAATARESANAGFLEKLTRIGAFGAGFAKHMIFKLAEFGSPLIVALVYRVSH
jgi:hypothetical protein